MSPLPRTLADVLAGSPSAPAVIVASNGPRFSRGELDGHVRAAAARLQSLGIQPGETVSIAMTNTVRHMKPGSRLGSCTLDGT
jgi:non-ribosomal peptide synthetase component E (peptide arylation enzyme)